MSAKPSRRGVLRAGLITAVAGVAGALPSATAFGATTTLLRRSRFAPYAGQIFAMTHGSRTYQVRLTKVGDVAGAPKNDDRRFRLVFQAVRGVRPHEGIYTFAHPQAGKAQLFVTPIGKVAGVYEATIFAH